MALDSLFKELRRRRVDDDRSYYGARRAAHQDYASENAQVFCFENYRVDELQSELSHAKNPALQMLACMYQPPRKFPDMSNFRLGPNVFDRIPLDWIVFATADKAFKTPQLIGHGVTTRVPWTGDPQTLPRGWQGIVRRCYENGLNTNQKCNTLVGLFINIENDFRQQGWALKAVEGMKAIARGAGLSSLIIPLRLPTRYEKDNATVEFKDFALLKREDGEYRDHWLRLHVRAGAEVIALCDSSHQHAMHLEDFYQQFKATGITSSGYHLALQNGEWFRAFIDLEREFALINEGCVWVQYRDV
ncbi:MAG TPA: hypothetical protein VKT49_14025 [Bryobacteraceae bacterium]|nr:hypothetical protein [Bryobacteraceae bacterium]